MTNPFLDWPADKYPELFDHANLMKLAELKIERKATVMALMQKVKASGMVGYGELSRDIERKVKELQATKAKEELESMREDRAAEYAEQGIKFIEPDPIVMARRVRDELFPTMIYNDSSWLVFDHNHYAELTKDDVKGEMFRFFAGAINAETGKRLNFDGRRANDVLEALKGECSKRGKLSDPCWLEERPGDPPAARLLSANNCLVDMDTLDTYPLTDRLFTRNGLTFDFLEEWACDMPVWQACLDRWFEHDPDAIRALQEIFGYVVAGDIHHQKFVSIVGPSRSGKGTISHVLANLVGKRNVTNSTLKALSGNFGFQALIGKRLMLVADMRAAGNTDELSENILRIVGNDEVSANRKFKDFAELQLLVRIVMCSNYMLALPDTSGAILARMLLIVMKRSFKDNPDTTLGARLVDELPAILLWSLEGRRRLNERSHFVQLASSAGYIENIREQTASAQAFFQQCLVLDGKGTIDKDVMYAMYEKWCNGANIARPLPENLFGGALKSASGYNLEDQRVRIGNGERTRMWLGVSPSEGNTELLYNPDAQP